MEIKKEIKAVDNLFWLVVNRYRYKVRQFVQMSDKEYDEEILKIKNNVLHSRLWNSAFHEVVKEIDVNNKKVQKGKEKSIMDQVNEKMEEYKKAIENQAEEAGA